MGQLEKLVEFMEEDIGLVDFMGEDIGLWITN